MRSVGAVSQATSSQGTTAGSGAGAGGGASKIVAEKAGEAEEGEERPRKRTKTVGGDIGLGIRAWGSPAR